MDPFDLGQGNKVLSVEKKGDIYIVHGQNNRNQPREIQVHPDGSIENFQGNPKLEGFVDKKMQANIEAIFKHFEIVLPKPQQQKTSVVSSEEPARRSLSEGKSFDLLEILSKAVKSFVSAIQSAYESVKQAILGSDDDNKPGLK